MIRTVEIASLAPTGEGVARTPEGVGFIAGGLPGEEVDAEWTESRRKFWRGRVVAVRRRSPDRVSGSHVPCPACDWAHFEPRAALEAKRRLFLETMKRIGGLDAESFGELPAAPSPAGYRIRNRFHAAVQEGTTEVGWFSPRSHEVEPAEACEMLTPSIRERLSGMRAALKGWPGAAEIATLESLDASRRTVDLRLEGAEADPGSIEAIAKTLAADFDGVRVSGAGAASVLKGSTDVPLEVEGRAFTASPATFFQANRFLVGALSRDVRALAADIAPGRALDAFAGVGLFAGALLDAGHRVVSVEGGAEAARSAADTRRAWREEERWRVVHSDLAAFARRGDAEKDYDLVVADPPRAGLGRPLAAELARKTRSRLLYVSCDPATLARDLPAILAEGFRIVASRLYDFYLFTHRVEALVALDRAPGA